MGYLLKILYSDGNTTSAEFDTIDGALAGIELIAHMNGRKYLESIILSKVK